MGGIATPTTEHPQWVLALSEHGEVVVQGGMGTLEGQVGDTILVVPDQALADVQVEIRDKLLGRELAPKLAARLERIGVQQALLTSAEEILRLIAEELGFDVPRIKAWGSDPIQAVLMAARQPGAQVRFRKTGAAGFVTRDGETFLRIYRQLAKGFEEGRWIEVDRVWVPEEKP